MITTKVHERIRHYMKSKGIMFRFVADRANIAPGRFYRLMNGTSPLVVDEYEVICRKGLDVHPGIFFDETILVPETGEQR